MTLHCVSCTCFMSLLLVCCLFKLAAHLLRGLLLWTGLFPTNELYWLCSAIWGTSGFWGSFLSIGKLSVPPLHESGCGENALTFSFFTQVFLWKGRKGCRIRGQWRCILKSRRSQWSGPNVLAKLCAKCFEWVDQSWHRQRRKLKKKKNFFFRPFLVL